LGEVAVNGARLDVASAGQGDPPFLFVHGLGCDRRSWTPQFEALQATHRCISVDLRGRGLSEALPPFDPLQATEDVAAVIEHFAAAPAIVVGHSLGGLIALLLNSRHGDLVVGTVLVDPPLTAAASGRLAGMAARVRAEGLAATIGPMLDSFFVESTPGHVRDYVREVMLGCPPDVFAGMVEDSGLFERELPDLLRAADRKPFMAIWPTRPLGSPDRLREVTTFLRQEPVADAGHFLQLEHPEVTTALLRAFVDDVQRDPRLGALS
jgi:pimeloyl-ACP methyl ester carboxylesterase